MKKLQFILLLILISCSGSKDYDEMPTPIGGDSRVSFVFHQSLGSKYFKMEGSRVTFLISISKEGVIEQIGMSRRTGDESINKTLVFAMKEHIKFTPATKDGKRVESQFEYDFTF